MNATTTRRPADDTLAHQLHADRVPMAALHDRYGPLLELVRTLIGVVPNCDEYLEIWPPAFRSYNVMVPNLLNLPFSIFRVGSAPTDVVGLGMYAASRAAACPYCAAHTCSFAVRRGAAPEKVAALLDDAGALTPGERAVVAVARGLGEVPSTLRSEERRALEAAYGADDVGWIVAGIAMMGFLNKFMDAIGVPLEDETLAEVADLMGAGWSAGRAGTLPPVAARAAPPPADGLRTKLGILPRLPTALRLDAAWQRGVPARWPDVGAALRGWTGHDFPVLAHVRHDRVRRAVATMLRDNLDAATTVVGLPAKVVAGVIFAEVVADEALAADVEALARHHRVAGLDAVRRFAWGEGEPPGEDATARAVAVLARAMAPSPAAVDPEALEAARSLPAAGIVELASFVATLQLLHRLTCWHRAG